MNRALVIVDVQRDFCEGGSLAVSGGNDVASRIGEYLGGVEEGSYALVVFSKDHHDPEGDNGGHFAVNPDWSGTWPSHCVAGTEGNELHPKVQAAFYQYPGLATVVEKGQGVPAYSAFEGVAFDGDPMPGASLDFILSSHAIDHLDVAGIATDYCVRATVLDGLRRGYGVRVLTDMCAGVAENTTAEAVREMADAGADVVVPA